MLLLTKEFEPSKLSPSSISDTVSLGNSTVSMLSLLILNIWLIEPRNGPTSYMLPSDVYSSTAGSPLSALGDSELFSFPRAPFGSIALKVAVRKKV